MAEIIFLSIVQGVTEFLPISSSAHLILFSKYFNFSNENLTLDISLHLGSLLATIVYFKKDLLELTNNKTLFIKIIISSIPVLIFGFLLVKLHLIDYLRSYKIIGWTTVIFGVLLYFSDLIKVKKTINNDFKFKTALYIGFFQVLSLVPGVSRSGITITAGRFFNFSRIDSAKISFLISIPVLTVISLYNIQTIFLEKNFELSLLNFVSVVLSFIFSYLTIKFFLKFLKKFSLLSFVIYRILLGGVIIIYAS
jgi:undecaprenyl-diphosphatase|tara:strand:+ start:338 stop:1093 length:756 start_codon:yes stop_codon:yes gene_type:complete